MSFYLHNDNGLKYLVILGKKGSVALLTPLSERETGPVYIVCEILEENAWYSGSYYEDFDEAYFEYKRRTE